VSNVCEVFPFIVVADHLGTPSPSIPSSRPSSLGEALRPTSSPLGEITNGSSSNLQHPTPAYDPFHASFSLESPSAIDENTNPLGRNAGANSASGNVSFKQKDANASSGVSFYQSPQHNTSAPALQFGSIVTSTSKPANARNMTMPNRKRLLWAPECAVYSTYDAGTYDRRSEPATCNSRFRCGYPEEVLMTLGLTPELAMSIKKE
jgi:hypothetical protein